VTIAVLDYGSGNLRSVAHALERVGADVVVTGDHGAVMGSNGLVVPGVGHFGACMTAIRERSHDATIKDFIATGRPMFGVCVGMQVLFDSSEEAPEVSGLGVFRGSLRRFPSGEPVPHMGWNTVGWVETSRRARHPYAPGYESWQYFAHSYFAPLVFPAAGTTFYAGAIVTAAVARDNVFATQFHPEKSGAAGLALYRAFVEDAER
jgi:imidazole glycerol phosphate synthase glutamine amidotransferase subunit